MSSSSASGNLALSGTLIGLSTIAMGLRLYARQKQKEVHYQVDDALATVAWIMYIGAATCHILLIDKRILGYSSSTPENASSKESNLIQISWDITGTAAIACIKLSAIFFYRRIFCIDASRTWFNLITITTAVIVTCWLITFEFLAGFQCGTHFSALWDGGYVEFCTISGKYVKSIAITNFILDVWILVLPIPRIMQLHTTLAKKLSIIGVFMTAAIGLAASIARLVVYANAENGGADYYIHHDAEHVLTNVIYFAMLEMGILLVVVNLPSVYFLFASVTPEKVIRSIRSVISLASLRSGGSTVEVSGRKDSAAPSTPRPSQSSGKLQSAGDRAVRSDPEA